ncbi:Uncharacterised protein [Delftia tsuruhatensis]|uniref:DUF4132 domain-containing protein n=1 Tax=Delftia tsuruhatensis TaxID=180282 RepID=UPI001E819EBD|nr:DUF4132 domain-containing protein [Delftia tsuruhatensis]CAB5669799.1 Uncharacterised protein [Delftia tsuruhatensis]CAC9682878.1 Uncharacterised protein [Delftia tsuruhatensis]
MNHDDSGAMGLQALYEQCTGPQAAEHGLRAFAQELAQRLRQGRTEEVAAFLRDCSTLCQERLGRLDAEHAPWQRDPQLWLELARISIPLGQLYAVDGRKPPRSEALSAELLALARTWLQDWASRSHQPWRLRDGYDFVLRRIFGLLGHEGMSGRDVQDLLRWALQLRAQAGIDATATYYCQWNWLLTRLSEDELLELACEDGGGQLSRDIVQQQLPLQRQRPVERRWERWLDFFARWPAVFDQLKLPEPVLIAQRWPQADAACRLVLAERLFDALHFAAPGDWPHHQAIMAGLLRDDAAPLVAWLKKMGHLVLKPQAARWLWSAQWPELVPLLLPVCAGGCDYASHREDYAALAETILAERPADLARLSATHLAQLLPLLQAETLQRLLPQLGKAASSSASKGLRTALAQALAALPLQALQDAGWLAKPSRNLVLAWRDVLIAHPDPAAGGALAALLAGGLLDVAEHGPAQARLLAMGQGSRATAAPLPAQAADPAAGLDGLEAQAARLQELSPAIAALDRAELLALLAPLSPHAARCLLHLAATGPQQLPDLARQLLAQAGAEARARLALALVEHWIACDGDPASRWVLKLLEGAADDRCVEPLAAAALAWHKARKERAVVALQQLGRLDSVHALSRVQALATGRLLKPSVRAATEAVLVEAAARRGMALEDLADALTPDFGLAAGLSLAVGEQTYRVELQGDLGLRVVNDKGRASKSLPAVKDPALQAERDAAMARLKTLAQGVKAVVRQQAPRLHACLVLGRSWPVPQWRRLFLEHPLLRVLAQGLVWCVEVEGGSPLSLRISEDFSLTDADSDVVALPDTARVALWHPVQASPGERLQWQQCLQDFGLQPLIDQMGAPTDLPDPGQWADGLLRPARALRLDQAALEALAGQWRMGAGPVEDGPGIYMHLQDFSVPPWRLQLLHGAAMPFHLPGHGVDIEGFALYDRGSGQPLAPPQWPLPLQATLQSRLNALAARAAASEGASTRAEPQPA